MARLVACVVLAVLVAPAAAVAEAWSSQAVLMRQASPRLQASRDIADEPPEADAVAKRIIDLAVAAAVRDEGVRETRWREAFDDDDAAVAALGVALRVEAVEKTVGVYRVTLTLDHADAQRETHEVLETVVESFLKQSRQNGRGPGKVEGAIAPQLEKLQSELKDVEREIEELPAPPGDLLRVIAQERRVEYSRLDRDLRVAAVALVDAQVAVVQAREADDREATAAAEAEAALLAERVESLESQLRVAMTGLQVVLTDLAKAQALVQQREALTRQRRELEHLLERERLGATVPAEAHWRLMKAPAAPQRVESADGDAAERGSAEGGSAGEADRDSGG